MMKKTPLILAGILLLIFAFVLHIFYSTGFFRTIAPNESGQVLQKISLSGVEDLQVIHELGIAILSSDDREARRLNEPAVGGLYLADLTQSPITYSMLEVDIPDFRPHGISLYRLDSSRFKLWVINHANGFHTVEEFLFSNRELTYIRSYSDPLLVSPNDLVAVGESQFYLTNDHQYVSGFYRLLEDYAGLSLANVLFFDGIKFTEAAKGIGYANGINYNPEDQLLFVGSSRGFSVKVYQRSNAGELTFMEDIPLPCGADNLEFDEKGNILIGCHPNLMAFAKYAKGKANVSPSEIIRLTYQPNGNSSIQSVFLDDGSLVSGSSVAGQYGDFLLIGNVKGTAVVVWQP